MRLGKPLAVGIAEEREAVGPPHRAETPGEPERDAARSAVTDAADAAAEAAADAVLRLGAGAPAGR
ncbi:hypothetical protein QOM21_27830 [Streptomyces sp. Pv4-95]|uniref:hypothetical protein n=1 Tax=Streptomyces sp. Pv4-95 TaxID=3049543 RepID=UPI0038911A7E